MPSLRSKSTTKRRAKLRKMGRRRKREYRKGTTPAFPIHLDTDEKAKKAE